MSICRDCGIEIRAYDDVVVVGDAKLHAGRVQVGNGPKKRQVGAWAAMSSRGQMAMGDAQRDTPINDRTHLLHAGHQRSMPTRCARWEQSELASSATWRAKRRRRSADVSEMSPVTEPIVAVVAEQAPQRSRKAILLAGVLLAVVGVAVGVVLTNGGDDPSFSLDLAAANAANAPGTKNHLTLDRNIEMDAEINNSTGVAHFTWYLAGQEGAVGSYEAILDSKAGVMYLDIVGTEMRTKAGAPVEKWVKLDRAARDDAFIFDRFAFGSTVDPATLVRKAKSVKDVGFDSVDGESVKHYQVTVAAAEVAATDQMLQHRIPEGVELPAEIVYDMYVTEGNEIRRIAYDLELPITKVEVDTVQHLLTEAPAIEMPASKDVTDMADVAAP